MFLTLLFIWDLPWGGAHTMTAICIKKCLLQLIFLPELFKVDVSECLSGWQPAGEMFMSCNHVFPYGFLWCVLHRSDWGVELLFCVQNLRVSYTTKLMIICIWGSKERWTHRSSGLYASNLVSSSTHDAEACGMSRAIPVPSCCGNLKSACCDLLARRSSKLLLFMTHLLILDSSFQNISTPSSYVGECKSWLASSFFQATA